MPARRAPSRHVCERKLDDVAAQQRDDPVDRTAEGDFARAPTHRLRKADALAELREQFRQNLVCRLAGLVNLDAHVVALVGRGLHEGVDRDAVLLGEASGGLLWRAVGFECSGPRRPADGLVAIWLLLCETVDAKGQASRSAHRLNLQLVGGEARLAHELGRACLHRSKCVPHER